MKRLVMTITVIALSALSAAIYARRDNVPPDIGTDVVSRGSIVKVVSASGTVEAVETVLVGTQVSGSVQSLYADFNSMVKKGQILARLDPSLIQADITRAEANLLGVQADRERLAVTLADTETKLQRARELSARQLIPATDLETAEIARKTVDAQIKAADAQITQARAALSQAKVNLSKTVITSPIDGIVISRSVDVGQTVAASLQAPTLFTIAADLTHMQVNASIDESDLGSIKDGQEVTFKVDAYPSQTFRGVVQQVRLNPVVANNVVTYAAIISAPNPRRELKPGMTANLTVEVARQDDVLRVPAAALRFKPSSDVLKAIGQTADATSDAKPAKVAGTAGKAPLAAADRGMLWTYDGDAFKAVPVKVGVTDGTYTEIVSESLQEGTRIATRAAIAGSSTVSQPRSSSNPLLGPSGPPRR
jgi:HlyD family secretion protein